MANVGKGHLFGDALFNADFFQLQNTDGEEIIKYTREGGLTIAGGGDSQNQFIAQYGVTDFDEIESAYNAGATLVCRATLQNVVINAAFMIKDGDSFAFKGYIDWETPVWLQKSKGSAWYIEY